MFNNIKWWGQINHDDAMSHYGCLPIIFDEFSKFEHWLLENFKDEERVEIIVRNESKIISHDMFEYLYGAIYTPLSEDTGHTIQELDELFKNAYAQTNGIFLPKGREISKALDFDRKEMLKFIEFVQNMSAQWFDFIVTPCNENWKGK